MGRLYDVPMKKDNPPAPDWVAEGVAVEHDTFGRGVVRRIGLYKRLHTLGGVRQRRRKALMPIHAMPHMRRVEAGRYVSLAWGAGAGRNER